MNSSEPSGTVSFQAGAAVVPITPPTGAFLYGYPHVPRSSTGVHDPLEAAALYLRGTDGTALLFLAVDLIFVGHRLVAEVRRRVGLLTGIAEGAILLSATHTHSGPVTVDYVSNEGDPIVPKADGKYLDWLTEQLVEVARAAVAAAVPAEIGLALAQADGIGTNRHEPNGPADPGVPVLLARSLAQRTPIGCLVVYAMHPTVLHEDSTLISADFPGFTRRFLQAQALPASCPVLYHNGASGNQSPRYVTRGNTFAEAQRLGERLGHLIADAIPTIVFQRNPRLTIRRSFIDLEVRDLPPSEIAQQQVRQAREKFRQLQEQGASRQLIRTAECDLFGAEETAQLARASAEGRLAVAARECLPAEIQVLTIGPWKFVAWPGEFFVEYALEIKQQSPDTFVITMANGELQGYIVTAEAAIRGVYESSNAIFSFANGSRFVDTTLALLRAAK